MDLEETLVEKLLKGIMDPLLPYLTPNILGKAELKNISKPDFGLNKMVQRLEESVYMPG